MSSILRDIFIITEAGKVIKSKRTTFPMEKDLFAMLITALYDFVKISFHKQLAMVGTRILRVDIIKKYHIFFVASSSIQIKHKKALKALHQIAEKFFSHYSEHNLKRWDGCLNIFHEFDANIFKSNQELIGEFIIQHWRALV